jgi:hypothetical protein
LLPPERFDQAGGPCNDILERDDLIRRHSASQNTTLRQPDGQSVTGTSGNSVVNETVCTEPTNAIELLSGFQIAFRHRHDFADRAGEGCDSWITMDYRTGNGRGDLDVREMKRRVEDVKGAIA